MNMSYINKRMEGVEIAESLLYKDYEKPHCSNSSTDKYLQILNNQTYKSFLKESTNDVKFLNNDVYNLDIDKVENYCFQTNSSDYKMGKVCLENQNMEYPNYLNFQNNSAMTNSAAPVISNMSDENLVLENLFRSTVYFRPISPDIFTKSSHVNYKAFMNLPNNTNSYRNTLKLNSQGIGATQPSNTECPSSTQYPVSTDETKSNIFDSSMKADELNLLFKTYSHLPYEDIKSRINDSFKYENQSQNILNKIFMEESTPLQTDTLCDSRFYIYDNSSNLLSQSSLKWEKCSETRSRDERKKEISNNKDFEKYSTIDTVKMTIPNNSVVDSSNKVSTVSYTTPITIPRGSYIFIPLSTQNYKFKESQNQSTGNINLPSVSANGLNKLIIGCYPVINQIQDLKLPNSATLDRSVNKYMSNDNIISSTNTLENWKAHNAIIQNSVYPPPNITITSKKFETSEFNYYLENVIESHKVLVKEKNKIWMERSFGKDENSIHMINLNPNNEKGLSKIEKEMISIKNTLIEIKSLLSKVEVLSGVSFIDQVYSSIHNSTELIQKIQEKTFTDFNFRNHNQTLGIDSEAKFQIENLKQLCCDLDKLRNFLWATYNNLNFDQQRHLLVSLNKLKSWMENKANMKNTLKLKAPNPKYQVQNTNAEPFISCHNLINNSINNKQPVKLENNSLTVPRHSFPIPASGYSQIPTRMTTIVHRFSNPPPINNTQFNYFRAPISNFTPPLMNTNKFPMGSTCRISYDTQPQIYTATPILASTQNSNSPRNFLFTQSSLVTPIIYQSTNRQIINNGSLNYMIYSPNTQII